MVGTIRRTLTVLFLLGKGGATGIEEYSTHGRSRTVFWFDSDDLHWGQATPFNTILLNERSRRELSDDTLDYVFLHEDGHCSWGTIMLPLLTVGYFLSALLFLTGVFGIPFVAYDLLTSSVGGLTSLAVLLSLAVIFLVPLPLISWIDEGRAELHSIAEIGLDQYEAAKAELGRERRNTLFNRVLLLGLYPPDCLVKKAARWRGIGRQ